MDSSYRKIQGLANGVSITVKQLCCSDPILGGNKYYKLKYNLLRAKELGLHHLVTTGGAYSNHLAATARAGRLNGFQTTGIVRGEPVSNITLKRASADGMRLVFVSRDRYRKRDEPMFDTEVLGKARDWHFIPEGGSNANGILGCSEILEERDQHFDHVAVCCGTGTTALGLLNTLLPHQHLLCFSVMRGNTGLNMLLGPSEKVTVVHDYHFGGYAKSDSVLDQFCSRFRHEYGIQIEPVYTGKLFFGLLQMISSGQFKAGASVLA
ncbi:MAG: 1-aminocyclopropane-1-carboxylate deaminase/D-cysteine desulfhydrase, partial [Bacteroidota bacterium]